MYNEVPYVDPAKSFPVAVGDASLSFLFLRLEFTYIHIINTNNSLSLAHLSHVY